MADERDFAYGELASCRLWTGGKTQRDAQFTVEEKYFLQRDRKTDFLWRSVK